MDVDAQKHVLGLLKAENMADLQRHFFEALEDEHRKFMHKQLHDVLAPTLYTNRVRDFLEELSASALSTDDQARRSLMLEHWYRRAVDLSGADLKRYFRSRAWSLGITFGGDRT